MTGAVNYPRCQQYHRLGRAIVLGAFAWCAGVLALAAANAGMTVAAIPLAALGSVLVLRARRWSGLARRSQIGARSEKEVRHALRALEREGWRIRRSLRWHGGGDIDHVAIGPGHTGIAFAIETKTRSYQPSDIERITAIAGWLSRRRVGRRRRTAIPILCLARTRGMERWEAGVAVVSLERLAPTLRRIAGTTRRPEFLRRPGCRGGEGSSAATTTS